MNLEQLGKNIINYSVDLAWFFLQYRYATYLFNT